jgi:hypothetical protein
MYRLYKSDGTVITDYAGYIKRSSSANEISERLDFSLDYYHKDIVTEGNIIIFHNTRELYRGVVIASSWQGRGAKELNTFDFGFYLNKNQEVYQFDTEASNAIRIICKDFNIPIGSIVHIPTRIRHIYTDNLSDTIKDILEQAEVDQDKKYRFEMREGKFYVEEKTVNIIKVTTNAFGSDTDITKLISNPSVNRSIENMRNSIKVVQGDEKSIKTLAKAQNTSLISQFGKLQEIYSIDEKEIAKAKNIAENMLKELARVSEEAALELVGNNDVRANRVLEITELVTGIKGLYNIKDCTHNIINNFNRMSVGLELL